MAVHRSGGRLLFEIPPHLLNKDLAAVERVAEVRWRTGARTAGGRAGAAPARGALIGTKVFRWTKDGAYVTLRWRDRRRTYTPGARLPVVRQGANAAPVVDVTSAYVGTVALPTPTSAVPRVPPLRSTLRSAHAFRDHVELEVEHVFADRTVTVHWSLLVLPSAPMTPRFADNRVGYYWSPVPEGAAVTVDGRPAEYYIRRFRLEKQHPDAAVSDVVKPIVFYLDPGTPKRWVPWIIRGVEAWRPAFEAAGFRNAIDAREAPTPGQDPDWSLYDASHSSITWVDTDERNAGGGAAASDDDTGAVA